MTGRFFLITVRESVIGQRKDKKEALKFASESAQRYPNEEIKVSEVQETFYCKTELKGPFQVSLL